MADDTGTCRSCGAPIYWSLTASGKRCPYDMVRDDDGRLIKGYESHFVTCPDRARWSKRSAATAARKGEPR